MNRRTKNTIEFTRSGKTAEVSFTKASYKNQIEKLAAEYPDDCIITARNKDGSIEAQIPSAWVKIRPPRRMSEERRKELTDQLKRVRAGQKKDV